MVEKEVKYSRSFTAGALLLPESTSILELYNNQKDWKEVKKIALETNIINAKKAVSSDRIVSELIYRLQRLSDSQISLFLNSDINVKKNLLWLAICKSYPLIRDFAKEVINEKYLKMDPYVRHEDFTVFFTNKSGWHTDLDNISDLGKAKLKQVLFLMLRQANIINEHFEIIPGYYSKEFVNVITDKDAEWHIVFPIHEKEFLEMAK